MTFIINRNHFSLLRRNVICKSYIPDASYDFKCNFNILLNAYISKMISKKHLQPTVLIMEPQTGRSMHASKSNLAQWYVKTPTQTQWRRQLVFLRINTWTISTLFDLITIIGETLTSKEDLQTPACTTPAQWMPKYVREAISLVHDEVVMKYYGCGLVVPPCLGGMKILDLGSGSGQDCFALSKLVGQDGFVTGVDMTDEQVRTDWLSLQKFKSYFLQWSLCSR